MADNLIIREARPLELDAVEALVKAAYAEFRPFFQEDIWEKWMANISQTLRAAEGIVLVAAQDGRLAGAVKFYPDANESHMGHWPPGAGAIRLLAVSPRARRGGIGTRLTVECLRRARELHLPAIYLFTGTYMVAARHIYEKLGFTRAPEFDREIGPIAYRLDLSLVRL